jgi:hypothetical protein
VVAAENAGNIHCKSVIEKAEQSAFFYAFFWFFAKKYGMIIKKILLGNALIETLERIACPFFVLLLS